MSGRVRGGSAWLAVALAATLATRALAADATPPAPAPDSAALDAAAERLYGAGILLGSAPAAPAPAAAAPPPTELAPPAPPSPAAPAAQAAAVTGRAAPVRTGFFVGLDFETLGFFETVDHVSPIPEIVVGLGDDTFRLALLLSTFIGGDMGYAAGLRIAGGTGTAPGRIGYNLGIDLQAVGVDVPAPGVVANGKAEKGLLADLGATLNVASLTYGTGPVLWELHLLTVGYFYVPNTNGQSLAVGGGLAASWFP